MEDISKIENFMNGLLTLQQNHNEQRLSHFFFHSSSILRGLKVIREKFAEKEKSEASCFNIFSTLRVEKKETKTHSAFIASLLDAHESHSQGRLFLDRFLELCADLHEDLAPKLNTYKNEDWHVKTEDSTDQGRLDIILRNYNSRFLIVIENKIYAYEQPGQLERYNRWLSNHKNWGGLLLFLTLDGSESRTAGPYPYKKLAYRGTKNSVTNWLTDARRDINAQRLNSILEQYCEILEIL